MADQDEQIKLLQKLAAAKRAEIEKRQNRDEKLQNPFHFADRLNAAIKAKGSAICVGLDPRLEQIPEHIREQNIGKFDNPMLAAAESILEFNKGIIDAAADLVPVVKLQIAFYEQYGHDGVRAFEETVHYAREKGLLTLADVKRGDIGSTAEAYAKAFLGKVNLFGKEVFSFDCDALTVAPYLGWDGIKPFLDIARNHGKGVFVLVKTSNPSSGDLQDLVMQKPAGVKESEPGGKLDGAVKSPADLAVYEIMGHYVESWGANDIGESGYSNVGAVVGATFPDQAKRLRQIMPETIFLVPGYGAQGGSAKDAAVCFNKDGLGAIVNSSRGITFAWRESDIYTENDYAEAARDAVIKMKKDLESAL
jgi:orotidine-5'-phosphate decarboxylase